MFGASEEQVRRVLEDQVDEADEADEEDVPAAENWTRDQGSRPRPIRDGQARGGQEPPQARLSSNRTSTHAQRSRSYPAEHSRV